MGQGSSHRDVLFFPMLSRGLNLFLLDPYLLASTSLDSEDFVDVSAGTCLESVQSGSAVFEIRQPKTRADLGIWNPDAQLLKIYLTNS